MAAWKEQWWAALMEQHLVDTMVGMMAEMSVHLMVATTVVMMAQRSADLLVDKKAPAKAGTWAVHLADVRAAMTAVH